MLQMHCKASSHFSIKFFNLYSCKDTKTSSGFLVTLHFMVSIMQVLRNLFLQLIPSCTYIKPKKGPPHQGFPCFYALLKGNQFPRMHLKVYQCTFRWSSCVVVYMANVTSLSEVWKCYIQSYIALGSDVTLCILPPILISGLQTMLDWPAVSS